jgi:tetratricopeptide (TPR) repeat protein
VRRGGKKSSFLAQVLLATLFAVGPAHAANPNAQACLDRSHAFAARKDYASAILQLNEAIRLDPNLVQARLDRVKFYCALDQAAKAFEDCNKLIAMDSSAKNYPEIYLMRAKAEKQLEMPEKVYADCHKALTMPHPEMSEINEYLLYACRDTDRIQEAINATTDLLTKYKNGNEVHQLRVRGELYEAQNQLAKAEADLQKALSLNPRFDRCYEELARVHEKMGKSDKAMADYNALLKLNADDDTTLLEKARLEMRLGRNNDALLDLNKVIKIDPKLTSKVYEYRAEVYTRLGQKDLAARDKAKVAEMLAF